MTTKRLGMMCPPPPLLAPLSTGFAIEKDYSELTALEKGLREIGQESLAGQRI